MTASDPTPPPPRPQRADARTNRRRILQAAQATFGEFGVDAQMTDVAARAQLAVGTVYRHFPTKEALVDALLLERLTAAGAAARAAAEAETDPWSALEGFLRTVTTVQLSDRSLAQFIGGRIPGSPELRSLLRDLFDSFSDLVAEAQRAGEVRADVEAIDIRMAIICVARAGWGEWPDPDWILQRYLPVVLDGLRAPGRTPVEGQPPPPDFAPTERSPGPAAFRRGRRRWTR